MLATYSLGGYFFEKTYVYTDLLRRWLNLMYRLFPSEPFRAQERTGVCCYNLGFDQYVLERKKARIGLGENIRGVEGHARASAGGGHPVSCFDFPRSLHVQRQRPGLGCLCGQSDAQSGQPVPRAGAAFSGFDPSGQRGRRNLPVFRFRSYDRRRKPRRRRCSFSSPSTPTSRLAGRAEPFHAETGELDGLPHLGYLRLLSR